MSLNIFKKGSNKESLFSHFLADIHRERARALYNIAARRRVFCCCYFIFGNDVFIFLFLIDRYRNTHIQKKKKSICNNCLLKSRLGTFIYITITRSHFDIIIYQYNIRRSLMVLVSSFDRTRNYFDGSNGGVRCKTKLTH